MGCGALAPVVLLLRGQTESLQGRADSQPQSFEAETADAEFVDGMKLCIRWDKALAAGFCNRVFICV